MPTNSEKLFCFFFAAIVFISDVAEILTRQMHINDAVLMVNDKRIFNCTHLMMAKVQVGVEENKKRWIGIKEKKEKIIRNKLMKFV